MWDHGLLIIQHLGAQNIIKFNVFKAFVRDVMAGVGLALVGVDEDRAA